MNERTWTENESNYAYRFSDNLLLSIAKRPAKVSFWVCEYCGSKFPLAKYDCLNCGAVRGNEDERLG